LCQKNETQEMHSYIGKRKVPQILALSADRAEQWTSHSWKWLSRMRIAVLRRISAEKRLSSRTMRIEQRKSILALLKVMLSHLDLNTMQVGVYNPETDVFTHLSLEYFAHKANLSLRRTQRAMAWLYEAGYVVGYRQSSFDIDTNEYQHKPSVRKITIALLQDLGITSIAIQRARDRSRKHLKKSLIKSYQKKTLQQKDQGSINTVKSITSNIASTLIPTGKISTLSGKRASYTEKIQKLMSLIPNVSLQEAQSMLPIPSTYK